MGAQWVYRGRQTTATEGLWNRRLLREQGRTARKKASFMTHAGGRLHHEALVESPHWGLQIIVREFRHLYLNEAA